MWSLSRSIKLFNCRLTTQCNFVFGEAQYQELLRCAECCEEAASLSNGAVGRREGQGARQVKLVKVRFFCSVLSRCLRPPSLGRASFCAGTNTNDIGKQATRCVKRDFVPELMEIFVGFVVSFFPEGDWHFQSLQIGTWEAWCPITSVDLKMERVSLIKNNRLTTKCSTLTWNITPCTDIHQGCRTWDILDILDCPQPQVMKRSRRSCVFLVSFDIIRLQTVLFRKSFTSLRRVERRKGSGCVSLLHGTMVDLGCGDHLSGVRHSRFNLQLTISWMNKLETLCHNVSRCIVKYCNCILQQSANNMKMILFSHLSFLFPVFCCFFEADLALQEQSIPGAAPLSNLGETKILTKHDNAISGLSNVICQWRQKTMNTKNAVFYQVFLHDFKEHTVFSLCSFNLLATRKARLTSAQRHAKRSAEYWERNGALEYAKDAVAGRIGRMCIELAFTFVAAQWTRQDFISSHVFLSVVSETMLSYMVFIGISSSHIFSISSLCWSFRIFA